MHACNVGLNSFVLDEVCHIVGETLLDNLEKQLYVHYDRCTVLAEQFHGLEVVMTQNGRREGLVVAGSHAHTMVDHVFKQQDVVVTGSVHEDVAKTIFLLHVLLVRVADVATCLGQQLNRSLHVVIKDGTKQLADQTGKHCCLGWCRDRCQSLIQQSGKNN